jgi:uncharacterized iron-regulated membrane protein
MTSRRLVQVHRYIALAVGAFIVVMGLTGALLVFRDELTAWFTPAVRIDSSTPASGQYERVLAAARRVEPQAASIEIVPSLRADRAPEIIVASVRGERHLFIDPHDGSVVADSDRQWLPFATFFQLHKRFMAGEFGEYLVAVAGAALALLAVTGLILWWPRKLKYAFRIRWSGNRLAVSFDLHRCAGAAFAVFLLFNAVTGVTMNLDTASPALVNRMAFSHDEPPPPAASSSALVSMKPLDEIVAAAQRAVPAGTVTRIAIGEGNAPVVVRKVLPGDNATHGMNRIYVDAASAVVLRASMLERLPPGNAMFEWLYPLHTGKLLGMPYKFLLVLVGLVPLISLVTGLIVWRTRAAPKRTRESHAIVRRATPDGVQ